MEKKKENLQSNNMLKQNLLLQISNKSIKYLGKSQSTKQNGITLIALVVTIVVLLILAGITISLVLSDNGIIKKAQEAANKTQEALENEQSRLNELYDELTNVMNNTTEEPSDPVSLPADGSYSELMGVNTPDIDNGALTPIVYDETANNGKGAWVQTESNSNWYSYAATDKKWANAIVGGTFNDDGTLDESATGYSMFVWIPRFSYQIKSGYHQSGTEINSITPAEGTGTIEIEFMKGISNEGATGKSILEYNGNTTSNYSQFPNGYVIHPAFNYGETVSGIWVAKFEASPAGATTDVADSQYNGTDKTLQVKPGVSSWRSITISNMYDVCKAYNSRLNSHLMKNDEWGAVAYLSKSKYGKETEEVWINNSSSYITGSAGNSSSATKDEGTDTNYTSSQGVKASTTGNVYGIYDMSGGAWEYVAAYIDNENVTAYGNSLYTSTDAKTKNVYTKASTDNDTNNYNQNAGVYGDAIYETSSNSSTPLSQSWHTDCSYFPNMSSPFFGRGGMCDTISGAGLFAFTSGTGYNDNYVSFRPVLAVL